MTADDDSPCEHWTAAYRTDPLVFYETEGPIFNNPELTRQEVDLVQAAARRLGTSITSPILDLACGPGRHGRLLARRGQRVVGLDLSVGLLGIASAIAASEPRPRRPPAWVCADLQAPPFVPASFESALLLGKSFGFFSERRNRRILERVERSLRPGGFFGFDLPDREPYLASIRPVESEERTRANGEKLVSEFRSRWRAETRRLEVHERHVLAATDEVLWDGGWDVRLYDADELAEILAAAGFARIDVRRARLVEAQGAKGDVLVAGAMKPAEA